MNKSKNCFSAFFKSWYANIAQVLFFASLSSFILIACIHDLSAVYRGSLYKHLFSWGITCLLLAPMTYLSTFALFYFDQHAPFKEDRRLRCISQFLAISVGLPLLTWEMQCGMYLLCYRVDLYALDDVKQHVAVLLVHFIGIQVYYQMAAYRRTIQYLRNKLKQSECSRKRSRRAGLSRQHGMRALRNRLHQHKDELKRVQRDLEHSVSLLGIYQESIRIRFDDLTFEWVPVIHLESVFLDKVYAGAKIVHARLLSGRCGIVDADSLTHVLRAFPRSLLRVRRDLLISRFAVRDVYPSDSIYCLTVYGEKLSPFSISFELYQNVKQFKDSCTTLQKRAGVASQVRTHIRNQSSC